MGPLFDFGRSQSGVESAEALAEQAEAQYRLTVLTAFNEVRDALYSYDFSERRLAAIDEQLEAVARTRELAVLMYDQGQVSQLERLDAERNLLSARLARPMRAVNSWRPRRRCSRRWAVAGRKPPFTDCR